MEENKTYKQLYLEQKRKRTPVLSPELEEIFNVIYPYQHWSEEDQTDRSMRRLFQERYGRL
jgi:hypothetical protein